MIANQRKDQENFKITNLKTPQSAYTKYTNKDTRERGTK